MARQQPIPGCSRHFKRVLKKSIYTHNLKTVPTNRNELIQYYRNMLKAMDSNSQQYRSLRWIVNKL